MSEIGIKFCVSYKNKYQTKWRAPNSTISTASTKK